MWSYLRRSKEKMDTLSYKTKHDNIKAEDKAWFIVDASNQTLGRLSTQIAIVLRGKHKASYSPHFDNGDNVIVVNAEKWPLRVKNGLRKNTYATVVIPVGSERETQTKCWKRNQRRS